MKKILLLTFLCLSLSIWARDNGRTSINESAKTVYKPISINRSSTDPFDLLVQRINNIDLLTPQDYLIDFDAITPPGDQYHENIVQYGGTDLFTSTEKTNLYSKLNTFNTSQTSVKLFVVTGRYFLGYHNTTAPIQSEIANGEKILNAIANKVDDLTAQNTDKKFIKDWISIWDQKRKNLSATNPKVLILFYIEGIFVDKNNALYNLESSGTFKIVDNISDFTKSIAFSLLNYGLPTVDWMKMNQPTLKKSVQNTLAPPANGTKIYDAVSLITSEWAKPLDLTKLVTLVETINGLSDADVAKIPIAERKQYLTKIAKHEIETLGESTVFNWKDDIATNTPLTVSPEAGRKALNKLLLNTPSVQADEILTQLETENVGSLKYIGAFHGYQTVRDDQSYSNFIKAITTLVLKSTNHKTIHTQGILDNLVMYYDNGWGTREFIGKRNYAPYITINNVDGKITYAYTENIAYENSSIIPGSVEFGGGKYIASNPTTPKTLHPFDIISFIDNFGQTGVGGGLFREPERNLTPQELLLGTRQISALELAHLKVIEGDRSFERLSNSTLTAAEVALTLTGYGSALTALQNLRFLPLLTEFSFATCQTADLVLKSEIVQNQKIKSLLEAYRSVTGLTGFIGISAQGAKFVGKAIIGKDYLTKISNDLINALKNNPETFTGISRTEAEKWRSLFAELEADYYAGKLTNPDDIAIYNKLKLTDNYLAVKGITKIANNVAKYPQNGFLEYVNNTFSTLQKQLFEKAKNFYTQFNPNFNVNELRGIDFDFSVTQVTKTKESVMYQMVTLDKDTQIPRFGSYFFENLSEDITKLGIGDLNKIKADGRVKIKIVLNDNVEFLKSTSANIEDWGGSTQIFEGGANQFYNPAAKNKIKSFEIIQTY